jgi:hypothetical protein
LAAFSERFGLILSKPGRIVTAFSLLLLSSLLKIRGRAYELGETPGYREAMLDAFSGTPEIAPTLAEFLQLT